MKIVTKVLLVLLAVFVIAQFFGPDKNDGLMTSLDPFMDETSPNDQVNSVLTETCFDCHSDHTRYPWYDQITPVNFWLSNHVEDGKKHLNFSNWNDYSVKRKDHKLEELIEMVEDKEMPLESYTWTHKEANLSDEQIKAVVQWAQQLRQGYSAEMASNQ